MPLSLPCPLNNLPMSRVPTNHLPTFPLSIESDTGCILSYTPLLPRSLLLLLRASLRAGLPSSAPLVGRRGHWTPGSCCLNPFPPPWGPRRSQFTSCCQAPASHGSRTIVSWASRSSQQLQCWRWSPLLRQQPLHRVCWRPAANHLILWHQGKEDAGASPA